MYIWVSLIIYQVVSQSTDLWDTKIVDIQCFKTKISINVIIIKTKVLLPQV